MKKIKGFTLAEILVALVIIGVVSALTIPTVVKKYQEKEIVARLKKTYSALAQATNQIMAEEGSPKIWTNNREHVLDLYKKRLKNVKECNYERECWENATSGARNYYKMLNGNFWQYSYEIDGQYGKLILADGSLLYFAKTFDSCRGDHPDWGAKNICTSIWIDLNGERKPNQWGRDMFIFVIKKDGLHPAGCDNNNACNKNSEGYGCACKVLSENAINY